MAAPRFSSLPGMAANMPAVQQQMISQRAQQYAQSHYQTRPGGGTPSSSMSSQSSRLAGHPYTSSTATSSPLDSHRKRPDSKSRRVKKKKAGDKVLPQRVRELVPESQAYMDLLAFEKKLDSTIMRKRLDIQEALKRPVKDYATENIANYIFIREPPEFTKKMDWKEDYTTKKRKLRVFLTTHFYSPRPDAESHTFIFEQHQAYRKVSNTARIYRYEIEIQKGTTQHQDEDSIVPSWELRVEGKLMDDQGVKPDVVKQKRKFSSFFRSLVIELDKDLYGPDNHLVEWHRTDKTQETDGFQVKRPGEDKVKCTIMLLLDYQPAQYKLDPRLARLLGIHTQTRPVIINALWQYIKTHNLQDSSEREYINNDVYFQQIFECPRMRFNEIPQRLSALLYPPDPIVIKHLISKGEKKTTCYDIDVEVDDTLKAQMQSFLLSTASQQEITTLDTKIHETVETINQLKVSREFFLGFAQGQQEFINQWITSQNRDLKIMTDVVGNPEEERHADFYYLPWSQEAVCRYFYNKVQQKRAELEQALGIRNT